MYQSGGSERDSDAERMIANEMRILESPNLQYALGLSGDELGYIAYAVKLHALSVARQIISNDEVNKSYQQAEAELNKPYKQEETKKLNLSNPSEEN